MASTPSPLAAPKEPPLRADNRSETAVRAVAGLFVIWVTLWLVFQAQRLSESYLRVEGRPGTTLTLDNPAVRALEAPVKLLLPFSMHSRDTSPRQALMNIAAQVGFAKLSESDLADLSDKPRTIEFDSIPLYQAIHHLIDKTNRGVAIQGSRLIIFRQQLQTGGAGEGHQQVDWRAPDLPLSSERLLIVPSGRSDIWFTVFLTGPPDEPAFKWRVVNLEVWKGSQWLTLAKSLLDDAGRARLNLQTAGSMAFAFQRLTDAAPDHPGTYQMEFFYQANK